MLFLKMFKLFLIKIDFFIISTFLLLSSNLFCVGFSKQSIALVTSSSTDRYIFSQHTLTSLAKYASRWGYAFLYHSSPQCDSDDIFFSRISIMLNFLMEDKHDWYVWFDDYVFITNPVMSLDQIIQDHGEKADFIVGAYGESMNLENSVNSGVFIVRNSKWSKDFLQEILTKCGKHHDEYTEERIMSDLVKTLKYKNSPYINIIPCRKIQSTLKLLGKNDLNDGGQWLPGDFSVSFKNSSDIMKVVIFPQFARSPGVYPVLPDYLAKKFTLQPGVGQFVCDNVDGIRIFTEERHCRKIL
jgi:hypothetical protein